MQCLGEHQLTETRKRRWSGLNGIIAPHGTSASFSSATIKREKRVSELFDQLTCPYDQSVRPIPEEVDAP